MIKPCPPIIATLHRLTDSSPSNAQRLLSLAQLWPLSVTLDGLRSFDLHLQFDAFAAALVELYRSIYLLTPPESTTWSDKGLALPLRVLVLLATLAKTFTISSLRRLRGKIDKVAHHWCSLWSWALAAGVLEGKVRGLRTDLETLLLQLVKVRHYYPASRKLFKNTFTLPWKANWDDSLWSDLSAFDDAVQSTLGRLIESMATLMVVVSSPGKPPALQTTPTPQHLPPPVLIGRENALDTVISLIEEGSVALLTGPLGIGKSSVAQSIIHDSRVARKVERRIWIDCEGIQNGEDLKNALVTVNSTTSNGRRNGRSSWGAFTSSLSARATLLVLDNLDPTPSDLPAKSLQHTLMDLSSTPNTSMLITSRSLMLPSPPPSFVQHPLHRLTPAQAQQVLWEYAPRQTSSPLEPILKHLDGHALSLSLVGSKLLQLGSVAAVVQHWEEDGPDFFAATSGRRGNLRRAIQSAYGVSAATLDLLGLLSRVPHGLDVSRLAALQLLSPDVVHQLAPFAEPEEGILRVVLPVAFILSRLDSGFPPPSRELVARVVRSFLQDVPTFVSVPPTPPLDRTALLEVIKLGYKVFSEGSNDKGLVEELDTAVSSLAQHLSGDLPSTLGLSEDEVLQFFSRRLGSLIGVPDDESVKRSGSMYFKRAEEKTVKGARSGPVLL
ncbi:ATPase-AAA-core domain-containing protein [Pseudohyphozyma bogoriensis]|nr:ATPase-AAA-core domain-containing protein [Pseudohyphozyma bogoriensis]